MPLPRQSSAGRDRSAIGSRWPLDRSVHPLRQPGGEHTMENTSAQDLISASEKPTGADRGELLRVDRRRFLQSGALTAAGLAALSGIELAMPPVARAQGGSSPVQNLELLAASIDPVPQIF